LQLSSEKKDSWFSDTISLKITPSIKVELKCPLTATLKMKFGKHPEKQVCSKKHFFMFFFGFPTKELKAHGKILDRGFLITRVIK
jgi:hypothetical protein